MLVSQKINFCQLDHWFVDSWTIRFLACLIKKGERPCLFSNCLEILCINILKVCLRYIGWSYIIKIESWPILFGERLHDLLNIHLKCVSWFIVNICYFKLSQFAWTWQKWFSEFQTLNVKSSNVLCTFSKKTGFAVMIFFF